MIAQRSAEWFAARLGKVTASRVGDLERTKKGEWTAKAQTYLWDLVAERLSGTAAPHFESAAMRWGTEHEQQTLDALANHLGVGIFPCEFAQHPTIANFGASPDGVTEDGWIVEVKCPETSTLCRWMAELRADPLTPSAAIPEQYIGQVSAQLACVPSAHGVIFAGYDPRMPIERRLYVAKVPRDALPIAEAEATVVDFLAAVDAAERKVRS